MDQYYSDIAMEKLNKAHAELINARKYIERSSPPEHVKKQINRIISSTRNLQDEIDKTLKI